MARRDDPYKVVKKVGDDNAYKMELSGD